MADFITKDQLAELEEAQSWDLNNYHKMLDEYAGITARPYTGYSYYDAAGNYIGNRDDSDVRDLLRAAYIEVRDDG